jgi:hypothetical protein
LVVHDAAALAVVAFAEHVVGEQVLDDVAAAVEIGAATGVAAAAQRDATGVVARVVAAHAVVDGPPS